MTPFGTPQPQQPQQQQGGGGDEFQERTLVIVQGDEKKTGSGKVYWRVKDSAGKWYSVWEAPLKIRLETAADAGEAVRCAIKITPGNDPNRPFYTIVATDNAVDAALAEGKVRAAQSDQPGGRGSQFGKRMHPDDALRVTNLACQERAIQMVALTIADKPEAVSYETYVKAKLMEYVSFLSSLLKQPLTPTPVTPAEQAPAATEDYESDGDIPF